jgi:YD repeat-containing protein
MTAAATAASTTTTYAYDAAGHLVGLTPPGGSAVSFGVDALGRIRTRGGDTYEYVGTSETVWRVSNVSLTTDAAIDALAQRTAVKSGTTQGFLLPDLHGNAVVVVNATETAGLAALRYDAWGQTLDSYDSGGSFNLPWRHQGRLDVSPAIRGRLTCTWYGMCMHSERTQVLLTPDQRQRLERIAVREGRSLGAVIRDAVDVYTLRRARSPHEALSSLFAIDAPVADWEQMKREIIEGATGERP